MQLPMPKLGAGAPASGMPRPKPSMQGGEAAIPVMHKGGVMKKDGLALLQQGETVRTAKQEKEVQSKVKKATSPSHIMGGEGKPEKKYAKPEKKDAKVKKGKAHKFELERKEGGYLSRVHHRAEAGSAEPPPEPIETVHPDLASVKAHLDQHMGDGGGEPMPMEG